jgi:cation transport protein ChaC
MADSIWIFGYGSLVWRPAFPFSERRPSLVRGWQRRFWQSSTDHRGVPESPGRVVTVLPEAEAECWGMAYCVAGEDAAEVLAELEVREQGGYDCCDVELHFAASERAPCVPSGERARALMYVATPSNRNYAGEAPLAAIALQVLRSHGPSGPNLEYVLRLAEALRGMGADDEHVFELERHVLAGAP